MLHQHILERGPQQQIRAAELYDKIIKTDPTMTIHMLLILGPHLNKSMWLHPEASFAKSKRSEISRAQRVHHTPPATNVPGKKLQHQNHRTAHKIYYDVFNDREQGHASGACAVLEMHQIPRCARAKEPLESYFLHLERCHVEWCLWRRLKRRSENCQIQQPSEPSA